MKKTICLLIGLSLPSLSFAEVSMGMRLFNNRWQKRWVYTLAPTTSVGYRWLAVEWDGTFGTYSPVKYPDAYSLQYRFSIIPSIRITYGFLFGQAGVGLSYKFLRDEFHGDDPIPSVHSTQKIERELRVTGGIRLPLSSTIHLSMSSGYAYIDPDNLSFFAGVDLAFSGSSKPGRTLSAPMPTTTFPEPSQRPSPSTTPSIPKTVTVVKTSDPVVTDINTAIESLLLSQGIRIINWDVLKMEVRKKLDQTQDPSGFTDEVWTNEILLASYAAKETPLDAVIQVQLNYRYETYGISASILGGSIKWTNPTNGEILAILRYEGAPMNMAQFKKKMESDIHSLVTRLF